MKKIILLLVLLVSFASSAINGCKTDVYFGNGVKTEKTNAIINTGILEDSIIDEYDIDYYRKHIGKVAYAYNSTHYKGVDDFYGIRVR
jgi:hypothetical protein